MGWFTCRSQTAPVTGLMLSFLNKYRRDYFASQNGEEGVVLEVVKRLGIEKGNSVEIGGANGLYCSNTALLIRDYGWSGKFIETDFNLWRQCQENWKDNPNVRSTCSHVDKYNINAFVDDSTDLLSLDTDGSDYDLFKAMKARPKIVIVEIDSSIPPDKEGFNSDGGAGYLSMMIAALERGYFLLAHTGNLILVRDEYQDLFPEIEGHPIIDSQKYFNRAWIKEAA